MPTAAEILARVREVYATCTSYEDEGEDTTTFLRGTPPSRLHAARNSFTTAFIRPDHFYFEVEEPGVGPESEWMRCIVCANPAQLVAWSTLEGRMRGADSIAGAVGAFAGVSAGTSAFVWALLHPQGPEPLCLPSGGEALLVGEDELEGKACWMLEGVCPSGEEPVRVWIARDSFLVLQLRARASFDDASRARLIETMRARVDALPAGDPLRPALERMLRKREAEPPRGPFQTESITVWRPRMDMPVDSRRFRFSEPARQVPPPEPEPRAPDPARRPVPEAEFLLESMVAAYASCSSYLDEGEVRTVFIDGKSPGKRFTSLVRFRTAFLRPDRFHFSCTLASIVSASEGSSYVLSAGPEGVHVQRNLDGEVQRHESILEAAQRLAGVSARSSISVVQFLLLGSEPGKGFAGRETLRLLGEDEVEGEPCWVLEMHDESHRWRYWIDRGSFFVRKRLEVHRSTQADEARVMQETKRMMDALDPGDPSFEALARFLAHSPARAGRGDSTEATMLRRPRFDAALDTELFRLVPLGRH